jgi:hypothetical protein
VKQMNAFAALVMLFILISSSVAYEYHMPTNVKATTDPEVLMPGDNAVVTVELQNGAASYGAGGESASSSSTTLATPINSTILESTSAIDVTSDEIYSDVGTIGTTDTVTVYYNVQANDTASDGTHYMKFDVVGGYDTTTITRQIPVKVDDTGLSLSRADDGSTSTISLNVANTRDNTLNAVSVTPKADGVTFTPETYYIGTLSSDELFTVSFDVNTKQATSDVTFTTDYKNGDNWHSDTTYNTTYTTPVVPTNYSSYIMPGLVLLALVGGGLFLYYKRKKQ